MDISFILSADEIFTLISLMPGQTEAGGRFVKNALPGAAMCDLSGLAEKKLARMVDGEMILTPAVRMVVDAITRADSAEYNDNAWDIRSPWISLRCESYPYLDSHWKITPLKGEQENENPG